MIGGRIRRTVRTALAASLVLLAATACTPPIRQFDLKQQPLTCEQANADTYETLRTMGFTVTAFDPAAIGRVGTIRATREDRGSTQNVTVVITCTGRGADIDASEDNRWLGLLEFKRGFYLAFTATAAQAASASVAARDESERPFEQKRLKGLQVLLEPVLGLGAKLDFDFDLAAAGVLPVRVTINNVTTRTYRFDPSDVVMIGKDGTRVPPLTVAAAAQRVVDAARQPTAGDKMASPDGAEVARRLQERLLQSHTVPAKQSVKGYLFYPSAPYVKGRISLEDVATEETEGFVVEFREF